MACFSQKIFQVLDKSSALYPASYMTLNVDGVGSALLEIKLEKVARLVATKQTLNKDWRTISLEASFETVDIDLKIELMLISAWFFTVVCHVPFHIFVESSESVSERGILNSFLICHNVIVKCLKERNRIHYEVSIARNWWNWVREECNVQNIRQRSKWL